MQRWKLFTLGLCTLGLWACSDDDGNTPVAISAAQITEGCTASCDWTKKCKASEYTATCMNDCKKDVEGLAGKMRGDIYAGWITCMKAAGCDDKNAEDTCLEKAGKEVVPDWHTNTYYTTCMAKRPECKYPEDICSMGDFFLDSLKTQMTACLSKPCVELQKCLEPFFPSDDDPPVDGGVSSDV